MVPDLSRYLNKTVLVSIPILFADGTARPYTLLGAEANGLWLQSAQLTERLLPDEGSELAAMSPVVFMPFAQIAGVVVATSMPADTPTSERPAPARRAKKS